MIVQGDYRKQRLDALLAAQNEDGGWGYFVGKRSWLEPTVYALLARHEFMNEASWKRGFALIRSWQLPDGGWKPNAQVAESHWSTALAVTLHCVREQYDEMFQKGVDWLLANRGAESTPLARFLGLFVPNHLGHERKYAGWPWIPGTNSWIEPTSHALVALKKAAPRVKSGHLRGRVALAEGMILRRRCVDGGWNYGSRAALGVPLPSYSETTGLALLGLQSCAEADLAADLRHAQRVRESTSSRLGRAWLAVSLRNFGVSLAPDVGAPASFDILSTALEAIASPGGGHALFRPARHP